MRAKVNRMTHKQTMQTRLLRILPAAMLIASLATPPASAGIGAISDVLNGIQFGGDGGTTYHNETCSMPNTCNGGDGGNAGDGGNGGDGCQQIAISVGNDNCKGGNGGKGGDGGDGGDGGSNGTSGSGGDSGTGGEGGQ